MDYTTELFKVAAQEFLFLSAFRQKVRKGVRRRHRGRRGRPRGDLPRAGVRRAAGPAPPGPLRPGALPARRPRGRDPDPLRVGVRARLAGPDPRGEVLPVEHRRRPVLRDRQGAQARGRRARAASSTRASRSASAGKYRERPEKLAEVRKNTYRLLSEYLATPERQDHARGLHGDGLGGEAPEPGRHARRASRSSASASSSCYYAPDLPPLGLAHGRDPDGRPRRWGPLR